MDADVRAKMAFSSEVYPPELRELVHPSQLERKYGGTAPNLTTFWPPHVPPIEIDPAAIAEKADVVPREQYTRFWKENPTLTPMPKEMRQDLEPLPIDPKIDEKAEEPSALNNKHK